MAKKTATQRRAPDMSSYVSPRMQKGVRYLEGKHKAGFLARVRKAFGRVKIRHLEAH